MCNLAPDYVIDKATSSSSSTSIDTTNLLCRDGKKPFIDQRMIEAIAAYCSKKPRTTEKLLQHFGDTVFNMAACSSDQTNNYSLVEKQVNAAETEKIRAASASQFRATLKQLCNKTTVQRCKGDSTSKEVMWTIKSKFKITWDQYANGGEWINGWELLSLLKTP